MRQGRRWQTAVEAPLGLFAFLDLPESALEQAPSGAEGGGAGFSVLLLLPQEQHCHTTTLPRPKHELSMQGENVNRRDWHCPFHEHRAVEKEAI